MKILYSVADGEWEETEERELITMNERFKYSSNGGTGGLFRASDGSGFSQYYESFSTFSGNIEFSSTGGILASSAKSTSGNKEGHAFSVSSPNGNNSDTDRSDYSNSTEIHYALVAIEDESGDPNGTPLPGGGTHEPYTGGAEDFDLDSYEWIVDFGKNVQSVDNSGR